MQKAKSPITNPPAGRAGHQSPIITIVAAVAENGVIGKKNALPWHLPADLAHFKQVTMGKPIIMGSKTYQSIGRPLPGRKNIVLSKQNRKIKGVEVVHSVKEAIFAAGNVPEICIIGGSYVFREFLTIANRMILTKIHTKIDGDIYFPKYDENEWNESNREDYESDEKNPFNYSFITLERVDRHTPSTTV